MYILGCCMMECRYLPTYQVFMRFFNINIFENVYLITYYEMNKILVLECNFLKFKYLVKCLYVIKHGYFQPYTIPLGTYILYIN